LDGFHTLKKTAKFWYISYKHYFLTGSVSKTKRPILFKYPLNLLLLNYYLMIVMTVSVYA